MLTASSASGPAASLIGVLVFAAGLAVAEEPSPPPQGPTAETVVVTAKKLEVERQIDRTVYSVATDVQSTFGTVSDVLTAIPSIDVDSEGVVSLRGDTNVLILVDGKPSPLFSGPAAGDNLQSIPAKDIERIEVITTPPAQFKAEGTAGIINIVLKKKRAEGLAGTLQASWGSFGRYALGSSLAWKSGRWVISATGGFRQDYRHRLMRSDLVAPDAVSGALDDARSSTDELVRREVPFAGVTAEYSLSDSQTLSAAVNRGARYGLRTYTEQNETLVGAGGVTGSASRLSAGHDTNSNVDARLGFSQKLSRPGETLDFSAHHSRSNEVEHYDYTNESFLPPAPTFYNNLGFREDRRTTEATADYALPLANKNALSLGYAYELEGDDYGAAGYDVDPATGLETLEPGVVDAFRYRQQLHALYSTWRTTGGGWTWQIGARGELTHVDARQLTEGVSNSYSYARLFPSVHTERALTDASTLSFGASRRISRPDGLSLDPYVDPEYTPNLRSGNLYLKPQYTESLEAGYAYEVRGRTLSLTGYYRRNSDSATDVTYDLGNGLTLTTRANLPRNDSGGIEFGATGAITPHFSYSVNGNAFYSQIDASALGFAGLRTTTGINAKLKLDWRPTTTDALQVSATRTDKRLTPQGYVNAINIVNFGYRHPIGSSLTIVATLSDAFNGSRYRRVEVTPTFTQEYERFVYGRIAYAGFVYSFGSSGRDRPASFDYEE